MKIYKFGGSSISTQKNLDNIHQILDGTKTPYVVVVSALSGITNALDALGPQALNGQHSQGIEKIRSRHLETIDKLLPKKAQTRVLVVLQQLFHELTDICSSIEKLQELSPKSKASILSFGERASVPVVHAYLQHLGLELDIIPSEQLICAEGDYLAATVDFKQTDTQVRQLLTNGRYLVGGFIAGNAKHERLTLGRGGSDYTAAILGAALDAKSIELWSDTNGLQTAHPEKVANALTIPRLSYKEAFELATFGAKALYPPTVLPAMRKNIPVYMRNTAHPEHSGTEVGQSNRDELIKGITALSNISMLTVSGVGLTQRTGSARRTFAALEKEQVNIILITQNCSEQNIGMGVLSKDVERAIRALDAEFAAEQDQGSILPIQVTPNQSIVAVVGDEMKNKAGLSGQIFGVLGENAINITAIAQGASQRNISVVVNERDERKALNALHDAFIAGGKKTIHLYIMGIGNVGRELMTIIENQRDQILAAWDVDLRIVGVANSTHMLFDSAGLRSLDKKKLLNEGQKRAPGDFIDQVKELNLRNAIFIDNTASEEVSQQYEQFLKRSISVVTCNKIACSGSNQTYIKLLREAKSHHCHFKYETAVGAALPIIKTIHDLRIGGDQVHRIEAVISGSLNFIFNRYDGKKPFADVVKEAMDGGYTEPDPLIDLSGLDVMRKILILARESGRSAELEDVQFESFLPESCRKADHNQDLLDRLKAAEPHFKGLFQEAQAAGKKLKVVARMDDNNLSVALQAIAADSPLFHLEGKDNVVTLFTDRYPEDPLVIKGAGAGARVTASGVFADVMSLALN